MKSKGFALLVLLAAFCCGCSSGSQTEKYQDTRDHIVYVHDRLQEISIDDVLIGGNNRLFTIGEYLLVVDYQSYDKLIHLFDKRTFAYVTSIGDRGEGPDEITNIGHIAGDEEHGRFYVSDHGKQKIFSYDMDSVIMNSSYIPAVKINMLEAEFPSEYEYFCDTLCIGKIIKPIGYNDFQPSVGKWNMQTGQIKLMPYHHPEISKRRFALAASKKYGIYVECYGRNDLMTICGIDGNLKCNIYGPAWKNRISKNHYYGSVKICGDKIIASYSGGDYFTDEYYPRKLIVFDIDGNYIKTLDVGYKIQSIGYDEENSRILLSLNDEIQFAYLELNGLL